MQYEMESPVGRGCRLTGGGGITFRAAAIWGCRAILDSWAPHLLPCSVTDWARQPRAAAMVSIRSIGRSNGRRRPIGESSAPSTTSRPIWAMPYYSRDCEANTSRLFVDDASHYSVWDGARITGVPEHPFRHLDSGDLANQLRAHTGVGERPLVISDGVFPISGEIAPAPAYLAALEHYEGGVLCLDDAHATGVLGERGRGTLEHWGLQGRDRCYAAHTLSKALGSHGGVIAGDAALIEQLGRNAKALVATSPSPLPAAAAAAWALDFVQNDTELRSRLHANVARAGPGSARWAGSCLIRRCQSSACARDPVSIWRTFQAELFASDICVAHVTSYSSTPEGGALRIAIFATHETEQIDRLVEVLGRLI